MQQLSLGADILLGLAAIYVVWLHLDAHRAMAAARREHGAEARTALILKARTLRKRASVQNPRLLMVILLVASAKVLLTAIQLLRF